MMTFSVERKSTEYGDCKNITSRQAKTWEIVVLEASKPDRANTHISAHVDHHVLQRGVTLMFSVSYEAFDDC